MSQAGETMVNEPLIRLNAADNVLIAREALSIGQQLSIGDAAIRMRAQVAGHVLAGPRRVVLPGIDVTFESDALDLTPRG